MSTVLGAVDRPATSVVGRSAASPWRGATGTSMAVVATVLTLTAVLDLAGAGWGALDDVLVVLLLLAAVPHGSVDHLVPGWRSPRPRWPHLALLAAAYAGIAAVAWWLLRAHPAVGLAAFLLLSAAHFGAGETTFGRLRGTGPRSAAAAALLGAVVVLLPLALHPTSIAPWLALMVPGWDGVLPVAASAVAGLLLLAAACATATWWAAHGRLLAATELVLLCATAVLVPPVLAIATYLGGWHAVRHTAVLLHEERTTGGPGATRRLLVRAALPSLVVLTTLAALWFVAAGGDVRHFVAEDTWLLAALTVPHAVVVWWLDRTRPPAPTGLTG